MARAQDLAGLAALGALAYHLRPGKNLQTETQNTGADPDAAMGSPSISALNAREFGDPVDQTERMADIGPSGSRAKVNPETNDLYYPEGAPAPARTRAAPTRSAASARAPAAQAPARDPRDLEQNLYVSRGARPAKFRETQAAKPSTVSSSEEGMKGYVPRRAPKPLTEVQRPGTRVPYENNMF